MNTEDCGSITDRCARCKPTRRWAEINYVNYLTEIILASKEPYMAAKAAELRK